MSVRLTQKQNEIKICRNTRHSSVDVEDEMGVALLSLDLHSAAISRRLIAQQVTLAVLISAVTAQILYQWCSFSVWFVLLMIVSVSLCVVGPVYEIQRLVLSKKEPPEEILVVYRFMRW